MHEGVPKLPGTAKDGYENKTTQRMRGGASSVNTEQQTRSKLGTCVAVRALQFLAPRFEAAVVTNDFFGGDFRVCNDF